MNSASRVAEQLGWTENLENRVLRVHEIRSRRSAGDQNVAFGARPFVLCGLPIRQLPAGTLSYRPREINDQFELFDDAHPADSRRAFIICTTYVQVLSQV